MSDFVGFDQVLLDMQQKEADAAMDLSDNSRPPAKPPVTAPPVAVSPLANVTTGQSFDRVAIRVIKNETERTADADVIAKKNQMRSKRAKPATSFIRDFPRSLVVVARNAFPEANQTDALAAFMAVKSGVFVDGLSDSVQELVDSWDGDSAVQDIDKRLMHMERQMGTLVSILQELELGITYSLFDQLGYRDENSATSRNVNLLEPGVQDLCVRLREQTKQLRSQEGIKNGRPIK